VASFRSEQVEYIIST